ncbi:MAG TPA: hypothetical protein VH912_31275 [Streptosporangiaceae bacterium]|jgi:hypothetical protein
MGLLAWFANRRKRVHTRAELEEFLERNRPNGTDLEKLSLLIGLVFLNSPGSREKMIARARQRGIRADRIEQLLRGDVAFGFRWDLIEGMLKDCGADSAKVRLAHDLFHDFPRTGMSSRATDPWTGQNGSIVFTDVAGFSDAGRTDPDRGIIRKVMYRILQDAFEQSGIPWTECHREDRGDGALIVVPPTVPTRWIVHPLLAALTGELERHNIHADEATRFQLRIALDVGPVESDAEGVNGEAIIKASRLVDAPPLKERLAQTQSCLGFIASDFVYDRVIKHRPGPVDPAGYQKIRCRLKGSRFIAWIYLSAPAGG